MDSDSNTNYLIPTAMRVTAKEIDGTTFIVENRYLNTDTIFRRLGTLMLDELPLDMSAAG